MISNIASVMGVCTAGCVAWIAWMLQPQQPFLTVYDMHVVDSATGPMVIADRSVNVTRVVADWRVTVVPRDVDAPTCQTVPGPEVDQGWSQYQESNRQERSYTLDEWAWDIGCTDRLTPGVYDMHVTWTPRDGGPIVYDYTTFTIEEPNG